MRKSTNEAAHHLARAIINSEYSFKWFNCALSSLFFNIVYGNFLLVLYGFLPKKKIVIIIKLLGLHGILIFIFVSVHGIYNENCYQKNYMIQS